MTYPTDKQVEAAAYAFHGQNWHHFNNKNKMIARRDMRAAIIAADQAAWEPIENAPNNGDPILICNAATKSMRWAVWSEGFWRDGQTFAGGRISGVPSPSHFRPLPLLPVEGMP